MTRRPLRRSLATLCTAAFAAGILGVTVGGPAGAGVSPPTPPATAPAPGNGVQINVGEVIVIEQVVAPIGPLSFT